MRHCGCHRWRSRCKPTCSHSWSCSSRHGCSGGGRSGLLRPLSGGGGLGHRQLVVWPTSAAVVRRPGPCRVPADAAASLGPAGQAPVRPAAHCDSILARGSERSAAGTGRNRPGGSGQAGNELPGPRHAERSSSRRYLQCSSGRHRGNVRDRGAAGGDAHPQQAGADPGLLPGGSLQARQRAAARPARTPRPASLAACRGRDGGGGSAGDDPGVSGRQAACLQPRRPAVRDPGGAGVRVPVSAAVHGPESRPAPECTDDRQPVLRLRGPGRD